MSGGPWGLIPAFFNAVGKGISDNDKAALESEQQANKTAVDNSGDSNMVYSTVQSPNKEEAMTPAKVVAPVDRFILGGYNPMEQVFAGALEGEKSLYSPQYQIMGGYSAQPTKIDSSQSPYKSSGWHV